MLYHSARPGPYETQYATRERTPETPFPPIPQYIQPGNTTLSTFGQSDAGSEHYTTH